MLFGLFKRTFPIDLDGFYDCHSHILPGVDDGFQTEAKSLELLGEYENIGFRDVWFTPHIMEDFPNETLQLTELFNKFCESYHGPIRLHLAAEYMMDSLFYKRLRDKDLLLLQDDKILLETSYFNAPERFNGMLNSVKSLGLSPLLAHPERYNYIEGLKKYEDLKEQGVLFQLNLLSLMGFYGSIAKKKSHELLLRGMYDYCGTDIHSMSQLKHLTGLQIPEKLVEPLKELFKRNK